MNPLTVTLILDPDALTQIARSIVTGLNHGAHLNRIEAAVTAIRTNQEQMMATQAQFEQKIDSINENTTASAAAAQAVADQLTALRNEIKNMGLNAEQEAALLARLDGPISTSAALKTFLEATAAGPVTGPEPAPVTT